MTHIVHRFQDNHLRVCAWFIVHLRGDWSLLPFIFCQHFCIKNIDIKKTTKVKQFSPLQGSRFTCPGLFKKTGILQNGQPAKEPIYCKFV